MKLTFLAIPAVLAVLFFDSSEAGGRVVCYYGSWAVYRPDPYACDISDFDPNLCTHIIYTFVGLHQDGGIRINDPYRDLEEDWGLGGFKQATSLKKKNPNLKVLVAIGGWNEGSEVFSNVCRNPTTRANFVKNAVAFVKKYNFDGFDMDWEYPANDERGGRPEDVENFSKLLQELRAAFDKEGLLLTAAVAAARPAVEQYYDVPALSRYLDFINVMAYDLHGSWDGKTGENAPLYASSSDDSPYLNVINCIETWIQLGADPNKIVVGMGSYGRTFTLANQNQHGIGAPTVGDGQAGPGTEEMGMLGYDEILDKLKSGWTYVWNEEQKVPYAYHGNQWVGYDNEESIKFKCDFVRQRGLGGAMMWSIDTDFCRKRPNGVHFPLLKVMKTNC